MNINEFMKLNGVTSLDGLPKISKYSEILELNGVTSLDEYETSNPYY